MFREDAVRHLDKLVGFYWERGRADNESVYQNTSQFCDNWLAHPTYFDTFNEIADIHIPQLLTELCNAVDDARIPLDTRLAAIENLSAGITVCGPGAFANLQRCVRGLAMSSQDDAKARLWRIKEAVTMAVLEEQVRKDFPPARVGALRAGIDMNAGNQVHIVNEAWNRLAPSLGLPEIQDRVVNFLSEGQVDRYLHAVCEQLTPDRIASNWAEECMQSFTDALGSQNIAMEGELTEAVWESVTAAARSVGVTMFGKEDAFEVSSFLRYGFDDSTGLSNYTLRGDKTALTVDVLASMKPLGVLNDEVGIADLGSWSDADLGSVHMLAYGDMVWKSVVPASVGGQPSWENRREWSADALNVGDLLAQRRGSRFDDRPLPSVINEALAQSDLDTCMRTPPEWVMGWSGLPAFTQRVGAYKSAEYQARHAAVFLGARPEARKAMVADVSDRIGPAAYMEVPPKTLGLDALTYLLERLPRAQAAEYLAKHDQELGQSFTSVQRAEMQPLIRKIGGGAARAILNAWQPDGSRQAPNDAREPSAAPAGIDAPLTKVQVLERVQSEAPRSIHERGAPPAGVDAPSTKVQALDRGQYEVSRDTREPSAPPTSVDAASVTSLLQRLPQSEAAEYLAEHSQALMQSFTAVQRADMTILIERVGGDAARAIVDVWQQEALRQMDRYIREHGALPAGIRDPRNSP
ncbi:hypothetical protein [Bordetella sp. LUAb4]|uniref:hypothetical protein n=1 Tax=Bordetella sp. LUAb4 TaxID=2843195 RepID=UPI001E4E0214|nr:hypothetical protein [Bordetella sp. LUAb4]